MRIIELEDELVVELTKAVRTSMLSVIGIDGLDGAGKTPLALHVTKKNHGTCISLDSYLDKYRGSYFPHLNLTQMRADLKHARPPLVIEGVLLLKVARELGITIQKLIYVSERNFKRLWFERILSHPNLSAEEVINEEADLTSRANAVWPEPGLCEVPELEKELIRYHVEFRPLENADFVFCRKKND